MIAQHIGVTRYFEKADRIGDYDQLRKIFFWNQEASDGMCKL
jgi:hypothetical protein